MLDVRLYRFSPKRTAFLSVPNWHCPNCGLERMQPFLQGIPPQKSASFLM